MIFGSGDYSNLYVIKTTTGGVVVYLIIFFFSIQSAKDSKPSMNLYIALLNKSYWLNWKR